MKFGPLTVQLLSQAKVSSKRIIQFLKTPEMDDFNGNMLQFKNKSSENKNSKNKIEITYQKLS